MRITNITKVTLLKLLALVMLGMFVMTPAKTSAAALGETNANGVIKDKQAVMQAAGIPQKDWTAADYIISHESSWRVNAVNSIGCIGLGQSCPGGSGLATACPQWRTDAVCQLRHFSKYAQSYGGWGASYNFWNCKGRCYSGRINKTIVKYNTWW